MQKARKFTQKLKVCRILKSHGRRQVIYMKKKSSAYIKSSFRKQVFGIFD